MPRPRLASLALVVLLAVASAGCGRPDSDSAAQATSHDRADPSGASGLHGAGTESGAEAAPDAGDGAPAAGEARIRHRLNEICRSTERALRFQARQRLGSAAELRASPPSGAILQRYFDDVVVPTRRDEYELLRQVERRGARSERIDAFLEQFLAATKRIGLGYIVIDTPGIEDSAFGQARERADSAGLKQCGSRARAPYAG